MVKSNLRWYFLSSLTILTVYVLLYFFGDVPFAHLINIFYGTSIYHEASYLTNLGSVSIWLLASLSILFLGAFKMNQKNGMSPTFFKMFYVALSVVVVTCVGSLLKVCFARYRPELLFDQGLYGFRFFSFNDAWHSTPSGHSLTIFAVCTSLSMLYRRYTVFFMIFAIMVALTRLVLEKHYLSDVILGAYLGTLTAIIIYQLLTSWNPNLCKK